MKVAEEIFPKDSTFHFLKYRKLQVDILTIFLLLLLVYSFSTLWYTYKNDKEVVIEFSDSLMRQVSTSVITHTQSLLESTEQFAEIEKTLITDMSSVSLENKELIAYMMNAIKMIPDLTILHVATVEGTWIGMFTLFPHSTYRNNPTIPLPANYKFAIQYIDRSTPDVKEYWIYKNEEGVTLETETVKNITYDPRTRPWFIGAEASKKPFWSPVYSFAITKQPGISIGAPVFNKKGELIAVTGGDIELRFISRFLSKQQIGKQGRAMILTQAGFVIAAPNLETQEQGPFDIPKLKQVNQVDPIFREAYNRYAKIPEQAFVFDQNETEYIASFTPYTPPSQEKWLIAIVVPASDFLAKVMEKQRDLYLISLVLLILSSILIVFFSRQISHPIVLLAKEVDRIKHLDLKGDVAVKTSIKEIYLMKRAVSAMKSALKSFGYYVPKEIVFGLMEQGKEIQLGGERKDITIFFSDIYDFTTISEGQPTELLMKQLSLYFEKISNIILECNGTIDKYIGDSIMAFWGAPTPMPDQEFRACHAALLCQHKLALLNSEWQMKDLPQFRTRIGIHEGNVIVGNIGTAERMNYTIMGDPVNLASRLESVNKSYKTKIIISAQVQEKVASRFLTRPLDIVAVKGKTKVVKIYELVGEFDGEEGIKPTEDEIKFCAAFEKAFHLFEEKKWIQAGELFNELLKQHPEDYPTELYLERIKENLRS